MDAAGTERGYRTQSDEAFSRSMAELKRFLAQRETAAPPGFAFVGQAPVSREVAPSRNRAGTALLFVAIAAATAAGLHAYGRLPPSSQRVEPPVPEPPPPPGPLASGDIAEMQVRLKSLGFPTEAIDGVAGPMTVNALKRHQHARGLPQTGDMTTDTLATLRREPPR